jgi:phage baseplate assembly protein W
MSWQWRGQAFPWDGTLATFIEPKNDEHILKTSIEMILFTRRGERVMLRDFGSNLEEKPFDPNDVFLRNEIVQEIVNAIETWDDRIGIEGINVVQQEDEFRFQIAFFNKKDPLKTTKNFSVAVGETTLLTTGG